MPIWLPIVINLVLLGMLVGAIIRGNKNGFPIMLAEILVLMPMLVGSYFLAPMLANVFPSLNSLFDLEIRMGISVILLGGISYLIAFTSTQLVKYGIKKRQQGSTIKIKGLTKEQTKELKQQQKEILEANKKPISKVSRAFGIILSILIMLIITSILLIGLKFVFMQYGLMCGYDYTLIGLLDKYTGISAFILQL